MRERRDAHTTGSATFNALSKTGKGDTPEAAALFYYLNRTGYNGLCRFNRSGALQRAVRPVQDHQLPRDFPDTRPRSRAGSSPTATSNTMPIEPDDFVYADPPYDVEFTQYSQGGFGWDEQERTAAVARQHTAGRSCWSNQATPRIKELYTDLGYTLTFLEAPRRISCTGDRTACSRSPRHPKPLASCHSSRSNWTRCLPRC